jgi:alkanesulfonate monooxygenase SsuD/methylene tetrahydromethanopterin reductase-like flavin-dependent oxidoreductase (luciferase family)
LIHAGLLAEDVGLDGFFIGDHPGYAPEPWLHLTSVAVQTERIELGSFVVCARYRHPAMLARLAADFDQISNGRLVLGLGIGWNAEEFGQLGQEIGSVAARQEALEETVTILEGIWGEKPFTFEGRHFRTHLGHINPGPRQHPRPPIIIAGSGEKVTLRQVAKYADACNFGPGRNTGGARSAEEVRRKYDVLRAHCDELGRPFEHILRTHFTSWLMIGETERDARAQVQRYYPRGMTEEQKITRIVGDPDRVAAYYRELVEAGVQYFVAQILDARDVETIRLFATEVAPRVRQPQSAIRRVGSER